MIYLSFGVIVSRNLVSDFLIKDPTLSERYSKYLSTHSIIWFKFYWIFHHFFTSTSFKYTTTKILCTIWKNPIFSNFILVLLRNIISNNIPASSSDDMLYWYVNVLFHTFEWSEMSDTCRKHMSYKYAIGIKLLKTRLSLWLILLPTAVF